MLLDAHTIEAVNPKAVTAMLRSNAEYLGVTVTDVKASPIGTGQMAASHRLALSYSTTAESAPASLIAKVSSVDETSRQMAVFGVSYLREVLFYRRLAHLIDTRTPRCFYAEITDDTSGYIALLEDLGPATTIDQFSRCDADHASLALGQAAALHGPSCGRGFLEQEDWLPINAVWNTLGGSIPTISTTWLNRFGQYLEPEHVTVVSRLGHEVNTWLQTLTDRRTLWHGDFRLDNILFDACGGTVPIAILDWGGIAAAPGIIDVSYFLGNSMPTADREKHERDLVNDYHDRLITYGVEGYSAEQCWREYQAHALYGLVLTIPVSLGVQTTERGDAMFGAIARRAADQIIANDSFSALAKI